MLCMTNCNRRHCRLENCRGQICFFALAALAVLTWASFGSPSMAQIADFNADGTVGFIDFNILTSNGNKQDAIFADGDLNLDGVVNYLDYFVRRLWWCCDAVQQGGRQSVGGVSRGK